MNTLYYINSELSELYMTMYEAEGDPQPQDQQVDPNAQDPNAQPQQADPNANVPSIQQADPNAQDPAAQQADPNAQAGPTDQGQVDPKYDPLKKYMIYSKIKELKHYLELYIVNSDDPTDDAKNLIKFIGVIVDFYELFDYESLKDLSADIMKESEKIIKNRSTRRPT